ncbi:MAG TPA: AAA family ATPase, partial [Solirubrobacteraceae bacterium]|nr:AAA family ATPase [Solirubrobacteraceae bacterium]
MDFSLAMSLAEDCPGFMHDGERVGTLAYLAPEQTGRTGRSVDQRADLYALGATLYELATGEPPFGSVDPLRITHDHLARVPLPPVEVNPGVTSPLSEIIMHLLEKEPDNRYQTAEGAAYDLELLRSAHARRQDAQVRIGQRDFPLRLLAPSRLVCRDDEIVALRAAFGGALTGGCRGVLVSGAAGVGKTALVDELRPVVTDRDGWFVAGKFDQYRRDLEFDAVNQAFRSLGRRLLAEPDDQLTDIRQRILGAVGSNAGLLTAAVPEFATLLAVEPEPGDPLTAQVRAQRTAGQVLRAVASRSRPVVLFLDDLQWAGRTPLGVVDLVLSEDQIDGLLLVGAYRESDDAPDPLAALLSRWAEQPEVTQVRLANLPPKPLITMVAEMLRLDRATAADLVRVIEPHSSGNPYETVELVNALRRDGALTATPEGWRWDEAAVRARVGRSEVATLVAARVEAMPATSRRLLEAMAALGGRAEPSTLQAATGDAARVVEEMLAPALDEGVLVLEPGAHDVVRFRHDRTREAILRGLDPQRRRVLQLTMARRLAEAPERFAAAAEQYLPVIDAVDDAAERSLVTALLRRAAEQAALTGDYTLVNTLLVAALQLVDPADTPTLIEVHTRRHAALYSLGRLEEADEEYLTIERLSTTALERADAASVQVHSLTNRTRFAEAVGLCLESLRELGLAVPATERLPAEVDCHFQALYRWLDSEAADGLVQPEISDPSLQACARLLSAVLAAAHASDASVHAWVSLEALRIWLEHGSARSLVGPASAAAFALIALRGDHIAGYRAVRRILASGEAAGYAPDTSLARFVFALLACWFEPIERALQAAQRAREGLSAMGDLAYAGSTYYPSVPYLLDCAPTLEVYLAEVEAGLAFTRRTGNEMTGQALDPHQWLISVLRGQRATAGPGEAVPLDRYVDNPLALFAAHLSHATAAAIFGDPVALATHTKAAMPLLPAVMGSYLTVPARLLRGLSLAEEARTGHGDEHDGWMLELDELTGWLATRAADAPDNFLHLLRLLEAERAWAVGDF